MYTYLNIIFYFTLFWRDSYPPRIHDHVYRKELGGRYGYNPSTQEARQKNPELEGSLSYKTKKPVSKTKQAKKKKKFVVSRN